MGIFDKVFSKETSAVTLSKREALASIAIAAVASDGDINSQEVQRVAIDLATLRAFRGDDLRNLSETLNKTAGLIKKRGPAPVLQAAKTALSKEECQSGFFIAADLVISDGVIEDQEKKFLEELQATLQIDDSVALKIVEVASIKNKA